jgi:hypothetical protein
MLNPTQEILSRPKLVDRGLSDKAGGGCGQKITLAYIGRLATVTTSTSLLIAAVGGIALNSYFAIADLSLLGASLVIWAGATLILSLLVIAAAYISRGVATTLATARVSRSEGRSYAA